MHYYLMRSCTEAIFLYLCIIDCVFVWCFIDATKKFNRPAQKMLMISIWILSVSGLTESWEEAPPFCFPRKYIQEKHAMKRSLKTYIFFTKWRWPFMPGMFGANDIFCLESLTLVHFFFVHWTKIAGGGVSLFTFPAHPCVPCDFEAVGFFFPESLWLSMVGNGFRSGLNIYWV